MKDVSSIADEVCCTDCNAVKPEDCSCPVHTPREMLAYHQHQLEEAERMLGAEDSITDSPGGAEILKDVREHYERQKEAATTGISFYEWLLKQENV